MQVKWEDTDIRAGRHVWRGAKCMLFMRERSEVALGVLSNGRLMFVGSDAEMAEYLNKWNYRPTEEV